MNMSNAVSQLIMQLGLYQITLPFTDATTGNPKPTENVIYDVLKTVTIPTYSLYEPWTKECEGDITHLKCLDEHKAIYLLPNYLTLTPVISIIDIGMPFHNQRGTFGDIAPAYGINRSVQGVLTSQAYMMVAGQMRAEPTWEYLGENKVRLFGFPKTVLRFKVSCEHMPNGETIPQSCYASFMELALLDVKMFLYNTLKLYDGIPTAWGQINLKTDDYQSAEADRRQLLDQWDERFHLDMDYTVTWM